MPSTTTFSIKFTRKKGGGEAKHEAPTEESTLMNARHEKLLELQALFAEAVLRSELQEADVQRLITSGKSLVGEMENLLRQLTG